MPPFANDADDVLEDEAWDHYRRFWRALVDDLLDTAGQVDEWPSSDSGFGGDGVTQIERMYRSLCDGRSARLDRAFSIQQARSTDDRPPYVTAAVTDYADGLQAFPDIDGAEAVEEWFRRVPPEERVPRASLDFILIYSEAMAGKVRALMSVWLRPETTPAEMRTVIGATPDVDGW